MSEPALPVDCDERIRRLYDYWKAVHPPSGGLPGRQHVDPIAMSKLLPWLWMVDVERNPLRFRYRLVGTEQVSAMDADFTGRFLDEVHPRFLAGFTYPHYVAAAERSEINYYRGAPIFHINKEYVSIERLLLPLAKNGRDVDMLLAITVYHRPPAGPD
ncbi:MAG: PAS domain-containing protein [Stellaceae bacterium]